MRTTKLILTVLVAGAMALAAPTAGAKHADPSGFCRGSANIQGPARLVPGIGGAAAKCGKQPAPRTNPWVTWCGPGWGGYIPGFGQWCRG